MDLEKVFIFGAMIIAGLLALLFILDLALGIPFGRSSLALDIMFLIGCGFVLWQGYDTYREFA